MLWDQYRRRLEQSGVIKQPKKALLAEHSMTERAHSGRLDTKAYGPSRSGAEPDISVAPSQPDNTARSQADAFTGKQRLRLGAVERYGEVLGGALIALVGVAFWLWPVLWRWPPIWPMAEFASAALAGARRFAPAQTPLGVRDHTVEPS